MTARIKYPCDEIEPEPYVGYRELHRISSKLMSPANKLLRDVMRTLYGRGWRTHALAAIASRKPGP